VRAHAQNLNAKVNYPADVCYYFIYGAGVEPSPLLLGLSPQLWTMMMIDGDGCGATGGMSEWLDHKID
jgi:hypothetical protein